MGKISEWFDTWTGRVANTAALWTLIPAGVFGVLSAWASSGVVWIAAYGCFGVLWSGLAAFFAASAALALLARVRLWRVDAKIREKLSGDSSPFDPMADVYHDKRLYLRDLVPAGRNSIQGRTFINCEIIGPGTAKILTRSNKHKPWPQISESLMFFTDCVESDPDAKTENAVFFPDCSFRGCHFYNLTLLFDERLDGSGWNWISRDYRQLILTDQSQREDDDQPE